MTLALALGIGSIVFSPVGSAAVPPVVQEDPVTGVWRGTARGDGQLAPASLPVSMWLQRLGDEADRFAGEMSIQGFDPLAVDASFDRLNGELSFEGSFQGIPFSVNLDVEADAMLGEGSNMLASMELEFTRLAREVLEAPAGPAAPVAPDSLSAAAWAADVEFLGKYLPQVHLNAFHTTPRDAWQAAIATLAQRMDELEPLERAIEMARVVALVGDAHTSLNWRELRGFETLPLGLRFFSDGLFVTDVDENWADVVGTRVVRVGDLPWEQAFERVSSVVSAENDSWRRVQAEGLLSIPKLLATLGITDSETELSLTVVFPDGEEQSVRIGPDKAGIRVSAPDPSFDPLPLWMTRTGENYWFERLDEHGAVYFAYNRCAEDPRLPMGTLVERLLTALGEADARRLVIDLRHNSGGNSIVLSQHIERIAGHPKLSADGALVALIGPRTYSSGKMNAMQLRWAGATLIGEATGGKPNSYGELRSFRLPNTGLAVYYSTKYFVLAGDEDKDSVEPDARVSLSAEVYFGCQDPVLERALD